MEWYFGEIDELTKELKTRFIKVDEKEFIEVKIDITGIVSKEELIEKINETNLPENSYIKIILIGSKAIEINTFEIIKYVQNPNIIKIKDKTRINIDLKVLSEQNNLKGIFIKNLLKRLENEPEKKNTIEKAIEIGLSIFEWILNLKTRSYKKFSNALIERE